MGVTGNDEVSLSFHRTGKEHVIAWVLFDLTEDIAAFGTGMDEGKPDTVHAMVDFTKEYGVYSK